MIANNIIFKAENESCSLYVSNKRECLFDSR